MSTKILHEIYIITDERIYISNTILAVGTDKCLTSDDKIVIVFLNRYQNSEAFNT